MQLSKVPTACMHHILGRCIACWERGAVINPGAPGQERHVWLLYYHMRAGMCSMHGGCEADCISSSVTDVFAVCTAAVCHWRLWTDTQTVHLLDRYTMCTQRKGISGSQVELFPWKWFSDWQVVCQKYDLNFCLTWVARSGAFLATVAPCLGI